MIARYEQVLTGAGIGTDRDAEQILCRQAVRTEIATDRCRSVLIEMTSSYCLDCRYDRMQKKNQESTPLPAAFHRDSDGAGTPNSVRNRPGLAENMVGMEGSWARKGIAMRHLVASFLLALLPSAAFAQRDAKIPDPDPEIERKIVHRRADGFEVNLFAADPLLAKPIQMNFDPQGRLWVASQRGLSADQAGPEGQRQDHHPRRHRRRRQGRQDHRLRRRPAHPDRRRAGRRRRLRRQQHRAAPPAATPTATARPTRRRVVLSGFGTEDTHHILHTFRWGPDGMLYFNQSIYIHSHIETPHGVRAAERAAASGSSGPRRWSSTSSSAAGSTRGAITSTAGASRSSPTARAARGSTTSCPGAYYVTAARRRAHPARA